MTVLALLASSRCCACTMWEHQLLLISGSCLYAANTINICSLRFLWLRLGMQVASMVLSCQVSSVCMIHATLS